MEYAAYVAVGVPGVMGLVFGLMAAKMFFGYLGAKRRSALIEDAPLCKAGELSAGLCKMRGRVVAGEEVVKSPLTRTPCVFYRFTVEELRSGGRNQRSYWHTVLADSRAVPCSLSDKTGEAVLNLDGAEVALAQGPRTQSGTFKSAPAGLSEMLQRRYNFSTKGLLFNKNLRYTEAVIEEGAKVLVVGTVKKKKSGRAEFHKGDELLLVTDTDESSLLKFYGRRGLGSVIGATFMTFFSVALLVACAYLAIFQLGNIRAQFTQPGKPWNPNPQAAGPGNQQQPKPGDQGKPPPEQTKKSDPGGKPQPTAKEDPGTPAPPANEALTAKLNALKDPKKTARVRALQDLAKMEVDPDHRAEVARALNPSLNDGDSAMQSVALDAAARWATADNRAALEKLTRSKVPEVAKKAQGVLDTLK